MGNQSDFDLRRDAEDEPRSAGVSQIRERARPTSPPVEDEDRDPVLDWNTHHAGSLQLPTTHKSQGEARSEPGVAASNKPQAANGTATRDRADAFSLDVISDPKDDAEAHDDEPLYEWQNDVSGEDKHTTTEPYTMVSLRREAAPPQRAPRRGAAALALSLAAVTVTALIALSGHSAHHTATAAASLGTRSPLLTNPLTSTATHTTKPTSSERHTKATATHKPSHHANRKAQRPRHHKTTNSSARTTTHVVPTVEQRPAATTYIPPGPTSTPAPTSTPSTSHSSSASVPSHQPAFGANGTLGPGSSPNG